MLLTITILSIRSIAAVLLGSFDRKYAQRLLNIELRILKKCLKVPKQGKFSVMSTAFKNLYYKA